MQHYNSECNPDYPKAEFHTVRCTCNLQGTSAEVRAGLIPRDALSWLTSRKGVELERGKILKQSTRGVAIGGLVLLSSIAAMYASRALQ